MKLERRLFAIKDLSVFKGSMGRLTSEKMSIEVNYPLFAKMCDSRSVLQCEFVKGESP